VRLLIISALCGHFVVEYGNTSNLGMGYEYGYGGGAMKSASYAAKAPGPYGGVKCVVALIQI